MRFSSLSLQKYGHFDNCVLNFEPGRMDFHLVFGANEAGKSTTMSAVRDLLFGYPHLKTYDFRYEAAFQRLAATLDTAAGKLFVKRRRTKGNRGSLLDEADAPAQDDALLAALRGLSREVFSQGFSLDHARLREGGRAMVEAKDDVGAALFEAGQGLPGAQKLLENLLAEADAVWGERRAQTKTYWQADAKRREAADNLKAARVTPQAYIAARKDLDSLQDSQTDLERERNGLQAELNRLQRIRRLAGPVAQRRATLELAGNTPPVFDASHEALHLQVLQTIAAAEIKLAVAATACDQADEARRSITPDVALLDHQDAVNDLVSAAGAAVKAAHVDLPKLQDEMAALQADADRLTREVGLPAASLEEMLEGLTPAPLLAALEAKVTQLQALQTRMEEARDQLRRGVSVEEQASLRLAGSPAAESTQEAAAALREGQTAKAVADRLRERQRTVASAERSLEGALRRLAPWVGTTDALEALVLPGGAQIDAALSGIAEAENSCAEAARAAQDIADRHERVELELSQAVALRRAISAQELAETRALRDSAWAGLRANLASAQPTPHAALAAYERLVDAADQVADQRFETAEASARLLALTQAAEEARLKARQARDRLSREVEALTAQQKAWQERLAVCALPALVPAAFRQWATDRVDALQKSSLLAQAHQARADDLSTVESVRAKLLAVCGGAPAETSFDDLLAQVHDRSKAQSEAATARAAAQAAADTAQRSVLDAKDRLAEREAHLESWWTEWRIAVAEAGLPIDPATLPALLPLFGQVRGTLEAAVKQQRRIAGIGRDALAFQAAALSLAAACGISDAQLDAYALTEKLRHALQRALQDDRAAQEANAALARGRGEGEAARLTIEAARAKLAPLMALAGARDLAGLANAIEASRVLRTARDQLYALEQSILSESEGYPLDTVVAEVGAADPAMLGTHVDAACARIADLGMAIAAKAEAVGKARAELALLDHGADAALAAADEQQARAAMAAEAETYLLRRAQAVMLKWAIDAYRRKQESPLLNRASTLFSTLTLGRYEKLDIDRASDKPRLVGHCSDGRSLVGVDAMSDGTADQLFLALRLAALEQSLDAGIVLPFLADDLFINFDDQRAHAGFRVLGEVARRTQVLFFTHHEHLRAIAQDALGPHAVSVCQLATAA